MVNKLKDCFLDKTVYILIGVAVGIALVYGFIVQPILLRFIDGFLFVGLLYLLVGIFRWSWASGDFVFFSYKPSHGSYRKWREGRIEERKDARNPAMYAGIVVVIVAGILAILY